MRKKMAQYFLLAMPFLAILIAGTAYLWIDFYKPPDWSLLENQREASIIYDEDGQALEEYCVFCRESIPLEQMGHFPELTIAAEDKDFRSRPMPISVRGVIRAFFANIITRSTRQGASTISQQVARNVFAEKELIAEWEAKKTGKHYLSKKYWRKGRETYLAFLLEWKLPRKKILELYLNTATCGGNRYGVQACARYRFQKNPNDLNPAETAWIIGLFRMPRLAETPQSHEARLLRDRVFTQWTRESNITHFTSEDFEKWRKHPMPSMPKNQNPAPDFTEYVRRAITAETLLVDQGLRIDTTLNRAAQTAASDALKESIAAMQKRNPTLTDLWGAALVIHAQSGAIKTFAQYPEFPKRKFLLNQIKRHCGSACKPFFYAAWLERGGRLSAEDEGNGPYRLADIPGLKIPMGGGTSSIIENFPYPPKVMKRYIGMADPLLCIAESRNACTMSGVENVRQSPIPSHERITKEEILRLMARLKITPGSASENAQRRGVTVIPTGLANELGWPRNTTDPGLTVALGSIDVSPFDMTRALTGFMGMLVEPYTIEAIRDRHNAPVALRLLDKDRLPKIVFEERVSTQIMRGLRATVEFPHGTGKLARTGDPTRGIEPLSVPVMGKTGTATNHADETTDNWFYGCTPSYCMAIWIGRENKLPIRETVAENKEIIRETGGKNALPVFIKTMHALYAGQNTSPEIFPDATDPKKPFRFSPAQDQPPAGTEKEPEMSNEENKNDF